MYPGMGGGYQQPAAGGTTIGSILQSLPVYLPQNKMRIESDVSNLMFAVPGLRPSQGTLTTNDGRTQRLLKLQGTLPIHYSGSTYNIPMDIWVVANYPQAPPALYVTPTSDMLIRQGHRHVGQEGLVYLPYLNQWNPATSNLAALMTICAQVFGQDPPVYAKPAGYHSASRPPTYQQQVTAQQPPPSYGQAMSSQQPPPAYSSVGSANSSLGGSYPAMAAAISRPQAETEAEKRQKLRAAVTVKLQGRLQEYYQSIRVSIDREFDTQESLEEGEDKLKEGVDSLNAQKVQLIDADKMLQERTAQVETWLATNEVSTAEVDVDTAVQPAGVLSRQLFECVAKVNAIDDAMFQLDTMLARETIKLPEFLKEIRKLARQQFHAKALALKVVEKLKAIRGRG